MLKHKNLEDFVNIGTLYFDDSISVSIAFKGENTLENQYIVNRFPNNKTNHDLFKKFFSYYSKNNRIEDFCNFFTFDNSFFCVFRYVKSENIKAKFNKQLCTWNFKERCNLLERILMKIDAMADMPLEALICFTKPENICIDSNKNIQFIYTLQEIFKNKNCKRVDLYNNIYQIIYNALQREADAKYNKALHIVLDKCKNGVYNSIPQLIVDLNRAEQISQNSSWFSYLKYQFELRRPQIKKLSKIGMASLVAVVLLNMAYKQITENSSIVQTAPAVSIGDLTYNANSTDESEKEVDSSAENTVKANTPSDITLFEGLDLEYEDYIVQYGDTIEGIAKNYYQDESYTNAIATFNGMEKQEKPTAGQIIKLPNRTAIALYLSN